MRRSDAAQRYAERNHRRNVVAFARPCRRATLVTKPPRLRPVCTRTAEKDASLIEFGRELFSKHVVGDTTYARVVKVFGKRDPVDLVAVMGQHASEATMLAAFDQNSPVGNAHRQALHSRPLDELTESR